MKDLHDRFLAWLDAGAVGTLARDVAIHASVCTVCQQRIAAMDALHAVDPGRAPMPPSRLVPVPQVGGLRAAGRFAGAAVAVTVAGTLVAVGAGQLVADRLAGSAPGGQVLDVTGAPASPTVVPSGVLPQPTATASASPAPTAVPTPRPRPVTPTARVTPAPTRRPTPAPTATQAPTASASPSATPTALPSPPPSATATPAVTPTPTPAPTA